MARLPRISAAIAGGLLLCVSFPPFGWWYLAIVAFALLAWVLTREATTLVGGFGYGFLFGAGVLHPAVAVDRQSGRADAVAGAVDRWRRCFPALFGLLAVVVRRLPGWPIWFAGLWALAEWLKSTVPFGGFPWGVVGFRPDRRPAAAAGAARRSAAAVVRGDAARLQPCRAGVRDRRTGGAAATRGGTARRRAAGCLHRRGACRHGGCLAAASASPVRAPATNPPSTSRPSRATCRGSGWTSTPSAARCSTTTSARRCSWPRTCGPGGRRSRSSSSGRRTRRTSTRWPTRTPRSRSRSRRRRSARRSWSAPCSRGRATRRTIPVSTNTVIVWDPDDRARRAPRQADRPAVRRVPAVARLLQAPLVVRRPGRLLRARQRQRRRARGRRADRGDDVLGGDLRPRRRASRCATARRCWRCRPTTPRSTRR